MSNKRIRHDVEIYLPRTSFEEGRDLRSCAALCVTAAVVGGVAAAGSVASASIGAGAAKSAAKTQADAAERSAEIQQQMYEQTRSDLMPYQTLGQNAMEGYQTLLGTKPGGMSAAMDYLNNTPGYQFAMKQGLLATQSGYGAHGLALSGAAIKGAQNYAENLASTNYQNILNNYYNALQMGESAASQTGTLGVQSAANQGQAIQNAGAASAAGTVGAANAAIGGINSSVSGLTNALLTPAMFQAVAQGGGMYGGW